uniref:Uncharacterized protein n=1 Tax=uncultured marine virus TaxID=186617 RepID=A0A0F7L125_9VIRU|nr:hypothetical protein [uncultured marine virus]
MSIFEDITLGFDGDEYTVKHTQVMKLIAVIEDIVTLQELTSGTNPKLSKIAEAYAAALMFAGAKVTCEEVYASLFSEGAAERIPQVLTALVMMMLPPDSYRAQGDKTENKATKKRRQQNSTQSIYDSGGELGDIA